MDPELLKEFLAESQEHLETVEDDILALEKAQEDPATVNRLFRGLHTIKGAAGFLHLEKIKQLSHALENVVGRVRSSALRPDPEVAESLLRGVDKLKLLISDVEDQSHDVQEDLDLLAAVLDGRTSPPESPPARAPEPSSSPRAATGRALEPDHVDSTVRIPVTLLDKLMNLATELVLVRNQNIQAVAGHDIEQLANIAQRLNVVTSDLQATVMQTRMRPIGGIFTRFNRIVRDLAVQHGKEIELDIAGAEVELDKSIIEAIGDPLTHLVRNAVGHGIEPVGERQRQDKPRRGRIRLAAFHRHGHVNIQIDDDGRGMDPRVLARAAVSKGLITPTQADAMSDRDAFNVIFMPGFSTSTEVTDLSGRGVGLDVVREAFGRFGGAVDVASRPGRGTRITIKLPLTLAIVPALIVEVEDVCCAIPQTNIDEVVWLHGADVYQRLKLVDDREVYSLRGKLLPILRVADLLQLPPTYVGADGRRHLDRRAQGPDRRQDLRRLDQERRRGTNERRQSPANSVYIIVLRLGEEQFGLLVDTLVDTEEIVVKSLHDQLKACRAFSGTTVLGEGRIALILDAAALVELGGLRLGQIDAAPTMPRSSSDDRQSVILFNLGAAETFAVPLRLVNRVEEVPSAGVHSASGREYVNYQGGVAPLVRLDQAIDVKANYGQGPHYIIVPRYAETIGVLANEVIDTVQIRGQIDSRTVSGPGIVGSSMIDGRLTLFLDLFAIIERVGPEWLRVPAGNARSEHRLLLVEDSAFYAALIVPHLRNEGVEVVHVHNGQEGLDRLAAETYDSVISDIEMPVMDGLDFVKAVRRDPKHRSLPMLAMSAKVDPGLQDETLRAGFNEFQTKLNQDQLLDKLISWSNRESGKP